MFGWLFSTGLFGDRAVVDEGARKRGLVRDAAATLWFPVPSGGTHDQLAAVCAAGLVKSVRMAAALPRNADTEFVAALFGAVAARHLATLTEGDGETAAALAVLMIARDPFLAAAPIDGLVRLALDAQAELDRRDPAALLPLTRAVAAWVGDPSAAHVDGVTRLYRHFCEELAGRDGRAPRQSPRVEDAVAQA